MDLPDLQKFLEKPMSDEQKGALYVNLALIYLKTVNDVNQRYLDALQDTTKALELIDKKLKAKN